MNKNNAKVKSCKKMASEEERVGLNACVFMPLCQNHECGTSTCECAVTCGVYGGCVCVPAFVHSPQVDAGEGGATLVPLAGVGRAPRGEALHADLGNPISRLAVQWNVATVEAYVPHAACRETNGKKSSVEQEIHCCHIQLL